MRRLLPVVALLLAVVVTAQEVNVGAHGVGGAGKALKVPLLAVVRVSLPSGQVALIQFTSFGDGTAEYRWRYRRTDGVATSSGTGTLKERYERFPPAPSPPVLEETLSGHDVTIRAGEILAEWSSGGEGYCYFYFDARLAHAEVLRAAAFAGEL
jgi:hypothetical protein